MQRILDNHNGGVSPYAELHTSRGKEKMGKCGKTKAFFFLGESSHVAIMVKLDPV